MMAFKGSCRFLFLLAILLGVFLAQFSEGASFRDFQNRHIDNPKTRSPNPSAYCNLMMARRRMTRPRCKSINTFINNKESDIKKICRRGTPVGGNIFRSKRRFRVIDCRNRGTRTNCNYVGTKSTKLIKVACRNKLPVHYQP